MFVEELQTKGIRDERVLQAMATVKREEFLPEALQERAYEDKALPIGWEQTISQPFIVAFMTEKLELEATDRVLEVGTGSGYQAAVLSLLVKEVYSVEIIEPLAIEAGIRLKKLGYRNVKIKVGDGHEGWEDYAPFDAIMVTCATQKVPRKLIEQLKVEGRMIIPVGELYHQDLCLLKKKKDTMEKSYILPVQFVPMTGGAV